jgi:hypothetical protein
MPFSLTGQRSYRSVSACAGVLVAILVTVGCDKVPLLAPTGTTITLSTNSNNVTANGATVVAATLLESSGTPVQNGTTVTFSTNLGRVSPISAVTVNGVATAQFQGTGQSGVAEIRATSGAAKPADTANATLKINIGAAAAGRISVSATPATVAASGGSSTISASVFDNAGNALRDVPVTFSTTAGTLSTAVANTDLSGTATTALTTSREATVTASTGAGTTAGTNTGTVTVRVNTAGSVVVTATPSPAAVGQTVGVSVALTTPATGSPFQRTLIDFGDGSSTTAGGSNTTVQHVYTRSGTFVIRATATDQLGDSASSTATLVVNSAPRPSVSISSVGSATAGSATSFSVTATPAPNGGAPIENVTVTFGDGASVNLGGFSGTTTVQHVYAAAGTYTATAAAEDTAGGTASQSTVVVVPFSVTLSSTHTGLVASFTANLNPPGTTVSSYFWNYGDGTSETSTSNQRNHTYTAAGTYSVSVIASSPSGQTQSSSTNITVP